MTARVDEGRGRGLEMMATIGALGLEKATISALGLEMVVTIGALGLEMAEGRGLGLKMAIRRRRAGAGPSAGGRRPSTSESPRWPASKCRPAPRAA